MEESLDTWFKREVIAHEAALVRYLTRTWRNRDEVHDLRQEVYIRVYEASTKARPTSPKSFLFSTARHLMTDRVRRNRVVSIEAVADLDELNVMVDVISPEQRVQARQELKLLSRSLNALPPKCREVIWLRKVEQISQKEVAARLGMTENAVEKHVMKGTRRLANAFFGRQVSVTSQASGTSQQAEATLDDEESEHGKQHSD